MIRLTNVSKTFNRRKANEIRAINNTSVELENTGLVTFLGESGCGKTTLLNAIGGLDKVDRGDIYLDDERLTRRSSNKRDVIRNAKIGYIFQNYNLIEDETVYENVALALRMIGFTDDAAIERRVMYILDRVGIARYRNRPAKMLSGGERQRVGIARAIVKNPDIIIADEPTGNLDSTNTIEIMNIIKSISREKLVILVTHERSVAEFYADRILEIVDGRIVNDRTNENADSLNYQQENKIFLQDMAVQQEFSGENYNIKLYSDEGQVPPTIKIVIRNNNLYIDTGGRLNMGAETMDLVDDHYQEISREVYENYEFHYDDYFKNAEAEEGLKPSRGVPSKPKYHAIYGPFSSLIQGFKTIHNYSKLKKILLLGFVLSSVFVLYGISNIAGITNITDDKFVTVNQNYLSAQTGRYTPSVYEEYSAKDGIDYVIPGNSNVQFCLPINDFDQTAGQAITLSGSLTDSSYLTADQLLYGRLPENAQEIVVDKMTLQNLLEMNYYSYGMGFSNFENMLGRIVKLPHMEDFTIVGISDNKSPCIYADKSQFLMMVANSFDGEDPSYLVANVQPPSSDGTILAYSFIAEDESITITRGNAPTEAYQVLVPSSMSDQVAIGKTISTKINGTQLTVCGYYRDPRGGSAYYVTEDDYLQNALSSKEDLTISPTNKQATFDQLTAENTVRITDVYDSARTSYVKNIWSEIQRVILVAAIILLISLIEIYLMLRASFLSRIREVGVLRAIGLKKGDIYRMFSGEVVAIWMITTIPSMLAMSYVLYQFTKISYMATYYRINILILGIALALVLVFNLIAGLLPVFRTLRKTPAAILSRNDVN